VKAIGDNAPRFLQPFAGAADIHKVGNDPRQGWRVDRALTLNGSLLKQRKNNASCKLFLFQKFLKAGRCIPRVPRKLVADSCRIGILHARKLEERVIPRTGELQL
jgi:hypothetical protein